MITMTDSADCKRINALLDPYLDSELPSDSDIALVESHLDGCASCMEQAVRLKSASDAIKSLPPVTMDRDLSEDLSFLERGGDNVVAFEERSRSKQIYAWAGALAAALVLSLLSYAALNQSSQPIPVVAEQPNLLERSQPENQEPAPVSAPPVVASAPERPGAAEVAGTGPVEAPRNPQNRLDDRYTPAPVVAAGHSAEHSADHSADHSNRAGREAPPAVAVKTVTCPGDLLSTEAVIAYDGEEDSGFVDLGISTNEDGLYAIKL